MSSMKRYYDDTINQYRSIFWLSNALDNATEEDLPMLSKESLNSILNIKEELIGHKLQIEATLGRLHFTQVVEDNFQFIKDEV